MSNSVTLQARYTWNRTTSDNNGVGGFNLATQGVNNETTTQSAQLTGTWVVNTRAVNENRFQYTRSANSQTSLSEAPTISVSGYFTGIAASQGPQYTDQGSYEWQNYTSLTRGAHFVKFGLRLRATREADFNDTNFNGTFLFQTFSAYTITLQALDSAKKQNVLPDWPQIFANGGGAFQYVVASGRQLLNINQVDVSPYVQDDWRIIPSVTLSLGLRYETQTNIHDKGDFAPRIGVAWGLGGNQGRLRQPKTVIRAGFGLFYDRFALGEVLTSERLNGIVQQRYVVQNPKFYVGSIPALSDLAKGPLTTYRIDPALVAPRIIQSAIGVDRQLPKNITLSVSYYNSRGVHELRTVNINAPGNYPVAPVYPMGNANPVYQYQSSGLFKQSQLSASVNARLNARYSMFGYYSLGNAHSNTDGVNTFPANTYDLSTEWSRARFDIRHRGVMGGSITAPFGIRLNPFLIFASAAPFNIVSNQDLNGDTVNNDRPSFATPADVAASNAAARPFVFATAYGLLNAQPTPGEAPIPRNFGNGFGSLTINMRVSRSWGFGESTARPGNQGGGTGGPRGGGLGGGRPGGGGGGGGGRGGGFLGGATTNRRYNLIASVEIRNLLNSVNPSAPVGTLGSPFFDKSQGITGGFAGPGGGGGGGATQSANRRLEMQLRFSF